jgi:hypothetical protein
MQLWLTRSGVVRLEEELQEKEMVIRLETLFVTLETSSFLLNVVSCRKINSGNK